MLKMYADPSLFTSKRILLLRTKEGEGIGMEVLLYGERKPELQS